MSLLTQFYPGPGGGGSSDGVSITGGGGFAGFVNSVGSLSTSSPGISTFITGSPVLAYGNSTYYYPVNWAPDVTLFAGEITDYADKTPGIVTCYNVFFSGTTVSATMTLANIAEMRQLVITTLRGYTITDGTTTRYPSATPKLTTLTGTVFCMLSGNFSPQSFSTSAPALSDLTGLSFKTMLNAYSGPLTPVSLNFSNSALTQASVDHVLQQLIAFGTVPAGSTISLSGGTSAAPSSPAFAATLVANGWSVSTN